MVGPNGSGKSNVIDAMLFVFGKRAKQVCCFLYKRPYAPAGGVQRHGTTALCGCTCFSIRHVGRVQLRLNKVSELIHKSTNFRNLDTARVSVHFQYIIDKVSSSISITLWLPWSWMACKTTT